MLPEVSGKSTLRIQIAMDRGYFSCRKSGDITSERLQASAATSSEERKSACDSLSRIVIWTF